MRMPYMSISWGGLGGQCRHIWRQSDEVSGYYIFKIQDRTLLPHSVGGGESRSRRQILPEMFRYFVGTKVLLRAESHPFPELKSFVEPTEG